MPSLIVKRGKHRWRASVQVNGISRQRVFPDDTKTSKRHAVLWEEEQRTQLEEDSKAVTGSLTLIEWAEEYLDEAEKRFSHKTYDEKRRAFKRFLKVMPPETHLDQITPPQTLKYLRAQANQRSGHAANKDRKNLVAAWNWGRKYINGFPDGPNPFQVVDRFPEERSPRYIPPEEDFWKVLDVAEGQDKIMLLTYLHLAARRSEVFNLTWSDVDFGNNRVRLWTKKREGGHHESDWLPMSSELRKALMKWWEERPIKDHTHVFLCLDEYNLSREFYGRPFKWRAHFMRKLCTRAGVRPFGFHAVRHLTASILYNEGESLAVIQAVLRHKNPNTTARYLHSLGEEHTREALERISRKAEVIPIRRKAENE
ncbi:MAG: tyrosine-type recombinase/integrase [Proteobacteria bacterium]|nr:tyrosine-type recombinase/integrase [Pseudomonadota bacterium]